MSVRVVVGRFDFIIDIDAELVSNVAGFARSKPLKQQNDEAAPRITCPFAVLHPRGWLERGSLGALK